MYENNELSKINYVKKVIDELDLFSNDISLSKMGSDHNISPEQTKEAENTIKKVLHFNKFIFEKIEIVTMSCEKIADILIDQEEINISKELKKIKQYVSNARNHYMKRNDLLKGLR